MTWRADIHIVRPDDQQKSRRTIFFEAPDRRAALARLPIEAKRGPYSGYEVRHIAWLEPF
ncbi:MAG: hypothetical protein ABSG43_13890 [Solirubrobacteraceae bacterium]